MARAHSALPRRPAKLPPTRSGCLHSIGCRRCSLLQLGRSLYLLLPAIQLTISLGKAAQQQCSVVVEGGVG